MQKHGLNMVHSHRLLGCALVALCALIYFPTASADQTIYQCKPYGSSSSQYRYGADPYDACFASATIYVATFCQLVYDSPGKYYARRDHGSGCVSHAPIGMLYGAIGPTCPDGYDVDPETAACIEPPLQCEAPWVDDGNDGCECPTEQGFKLEGGECVPDPCAAYPGTTEDPLTGECTCGLDKEYVPSATYPGCYSYCPNDTHRDPVSGICVASCDASNGEYWDQNTSSCKSFCQSPATWGPNGCENPNPECPPGTTLSNGQCKSVCSSGTHWDVGTSMCVQDDPAQCPPGYTMGSGQCIPDDPPGCPSGMQLYQGTCVYPNQPPPGGGDGGGGGGDGGGGGGGDSPPTDPETPVSCPLGATWNGSTCVGETPTCPIGSSWQNGQCVATSPPVCPNGSPTVNGICPPEIPICPTGSTWDSVGSVCTVNLVCPDGSAYDGMCAAQCPAGAYWSGSACVPEEDPTCPTGFAYNGAQCVLDGDPTCPTGTEWTGTSCVPNDLPTCSDGSTPGPDGCVTDPTCPSGSSWNGSACAADDDPTCPSGSTWNGSVCAGDMPTCPDGQILTAADTCIPDSNEPGECPSGYDQVQQAGGFVCMPTDEQPGDQPIACPPGMQVQGSGETAVCVSACATNTILTPTGCSPVSADCPETYQWHAESQSCLPSPSSYTESACDSTPQCQGDPIQCGIAQILHRQECFVQDTEGTEDPDGLINPDGIGHPMDDAETIDVPSLDYQTVAGSCPAPFQINIPAPYAASIEIPTEYICTLAESLAPIVVSIALLLAGRIVLT